MARLEWNETSFDLMTAEEVASLLRVKLSTVYQAAADGRIPCVRLWKGNRRDLVRFRRADVDRLIQAPSASVKGRTDGH